jgi:uncharacterized membrane protein
MAGNKLCSCGHSYWHINVRKKAFFFSALIFDLVMWQMGVISKDNEIISIIALIPLLLSGIYLFPLNCFKIIDGLGTADESGDSHV